MDGANRTQLWNRDLKIGKQLEQKRLERFIRPVDFIHQQNRRHEFGSDRSQQRALQQKFR